MRKKEQWERKWKKIGEYNEEDARREEGRGNRRVKMEKISESDLEKEERMKK